MRKTRPWLYVFLPVLYLGIIFGLVVFQFSKKSDSFSQSLGDMTVSGKTSETGEPVDLSLHGRGLELPFSSSRTLALVFADGTTKKVRPTKWAWKDGNLVVQFETGIVLSLEKTGTGGGILLLKVALPADITATAVHVPFAGEGGARVERNASLPLVVITRGSQKFLASLDGALDRVEPDNTFILGVRRSPAGTPTLRPIRLEGLPEGVSPVYQWLVQGAGPGVVTQARDALSQYLERAWKSWGDTRLKTARGGWLMADGSVRFSSRLAAAWAREALARGTYPAVLARLQSLLADNPTPWNYDALPFLGNLMEVTQAQRRTVESLTLASPPDWAGGLRLWLDARYYGPDGAAARLQKLLQTGELPTKTADLVGFLANLGSLRAADSTLDTSDRVTQVVTQLIGRVIRHEGQLFVATAEGYHDLKSGLIFGQLLLDQTSNVNTDQWQAIGSQLVLSALTEQDALSRIPEVLILTPGQADRTEGGFYPEDLYSGLLATGSPEQVLTKAAGLSTGAFVRSALPLVSQTSASLQLKFTFQFPTGSAESLVIVGVQPFDSILLHGIRWRTDPQFQSYTDGWYYSASTQTLYVKVKHREDQEELVINLLPPQN
ncbi:MAG: hypothetical protein WCG80_11185 [Spirochaetales bacterium]